LHKEAVTKAGQALLWDGEFFPAQRTQKVTLNAALIYVRLQAVQAEGVYAWQTLRLLEGRQAQRTF